MPSAFDETCDVLERAITPAVRREIIDAVHSRGDPARSTSALRAAVTSHTLPTAGKAIALERLVRALDRDTRREGFHFLECWDYVAHRFAPKPAVTLLISRTLADAPPPDLAPALGVLLDQYFLAVLSLCTARAWDDGDANANFERVTRLVRRLGDDAGSPPLVSDAESLLLLAISQYHPRESAYATLLDRVRALDASHRLNVARPLAGIMGSHLRWGFHFMYGRDVGAMRADNVVDYPWLLFSLSALAQAPGDDADTACALMNALSADPWAFTSAAPPTAFASSPEAARHREFREILMSRRDALLSVFERHQPRRGEYSPLGFACNFLCNASVAMVELAVRCGEPRPSLNALLIGGEVGLTVYAEKLMAHSRSQAATADGVTLVMYDERIAHAAFNQLMRELGEGAPAN